MFARTKLCFCILGLFALVVSPLIAEAGSGSRSAPSRSNQGSGSRAYKNSGSGHRAPTELFVRYEGKLKKRSDDPKNEPTLSGFLRLKDGIVFAETGPATNLQAATGSRVGVRLVGTSELEPQPIGKYRVTPSGRMTLQFGEQKGSRRSRRNADPEPAAEASGLRGSEGEGDREEEGSATKSTTSGTPANPPLRGVMSLKPKKTRSGQYWTGNYREQGPDGKTLRTWQMKVRPADDLGRGV